MPIKAAAVAKLLRKAERVYLQPAVREDGLVGYVSDTFAAFMLDDALEQAVGGIDYKLLGGGCLFNKTLSSEKKIDLRKLLDGMRPDEPERYLLTPLPFYLEAPNGTAKLLQKADGSDLLIDKKYWDCLGLSLDEHPIYTNITGDAMMVGEYQTGGIPSRAIAYIAGMRTDLMEYIIIKKEDV